MGCLKLASSIGVLSDKTPLAMTKAHQYATFHLPDTEINGLQKTSPTSVVRNDHHAGPSMPLTSLGTRSFLKAFCRLLQQWPCLEVRDEDAVHSEDAQPVYKGGSLRVRDDITVCISGPWEKSRFPFLGHVTYGICISGPGSPNLSPVTAGIRRSLSARRKQLVQEIGLAWWFL